MEKTNRVLRNERSNVQITDIISQFIDMKKEDVLKVLEHRKKELREHAPFLYELLCDIDTFHNLKMDREREEIFINVEKEVLESIPKEIKNKIIGRYQALNNEKHNIHKEYREEYKKAYREFIVLLHKKEIILTPTEAIFPWANIAIQYKELVFPNQAWYRITTYKGFDGKDVTRHEVDTKAFEEGDECHQNFMEVLNSVKDSGLYILTEDDIEKITATYSWWNYKKLDALLYCIWDPGEFIIDSKTHKEYHGFWDYSYNTDELPFLSLHEKGWYYKTILKAYEYKQKWHTFWSFLLARKI